MVDKQFFSSTIHIFQGTDRSKSMSPTHLLTNTKRYLENDWISEQIKLNKSEGEKEIRTHQWMLEMENKRAMQMSMVIFCALINSHKKVLDVGAGIMHSL